MYKNNDNTNAFLIHISAFLGFVIPFGSILIPLVLWKTQKNPTSFIEHHGKEAVNFNISFALYKMLLGLAIVPSLWNTISTIIEQLSNTDMTYTYTYTYDFGAPEIFGTAGLFSIIGIFSFVKIILIVLASLKAQRGEIYRYPLTIKFIK